MNEIQILIVAITIHKRLDFGMERVLSVDEISEQYWVAASSSSSSSSSSFKSKMNRSESEWAFQQFLQQEAASSSSNSDHDDDHHHAKLKKESNTNIPVTLHVDSQDYHAILKTKLNLACAAVAMTRVCSFFGTTPCFFFLVSSWNCFILYLKQFLFIYFF